MFNRDFVDSVKVWANSSLLQPTQKPKSYANEAWDRLPQVDYKQNRFRTLSEPEEARVFDTDDGFEIEAFGVRPVEIETIHVGEFQSTDTNLFEQDASTDEHHANDTDLMPSDVIESQSSTDSNAQANAHAMDEEKLEEIRQESFQQGLTQGIDQGVVQGIEQGLALGIEQGLAQGIEQGKAEGLAQGIEEGIAKGSADTEMRIREELREQFALELNQALDSQKTELLAQLEKDKKMLQEIGSKIQNLSENAHQMFEPLKRLSVHIAEQLVLGELNLSGQSIVRLVQRCLDELENHGKSMITVELHPQDKARLEEMGEDVIQGIHVIASSQLQSGSVRVIANETQIEDLIQNRLQTMAERLLGQPEVWREKSTLMKKPLSQRETDVQDLAARPLSFDKSNPGGSND